ncbi:MAG: phosphoenolpyruvate--protein phosphotransferase [Limisphaerales bacterium]
MAERPSTGETTLQGIPVSGGVCRGRILVLGQTYDSLPQNPLQPVDENKELKRLEEAIVLTRQQLLDIQHRVALSMGADESGIFEAHLLVLEDPVLMAEVNRLICEKQSPAETAFHQVAQRYMDGLGRIEDEYLRERVADMRDVTNRVLANLTGRAAASDIPHLSEPCIIVSYDLSPSTTAMLDRQMVLGFATDIGGRTSHTAIMARSLQIPAIVGLRDASRQLRTGQHVLLDGFHGLLIINPSDQTLFQYGQLQQRHVDFAQKLVTIRDESAITLDGQHITLSANLERSTDLDSVRASGAEGVGLLRTEFLYLNRETLPSEDEQYEVYRAVADAAHPQQVVIRTLDLGGDKFLSHLQIPQEMNPFLGWRAIRYCLQETEVFRSQLRAICRASAAGNVKMMYPMISGLHELVQANNLLRQYQAELQTENIPFDPNMEVGAMIEVPSAVLVADDLAQHAKFFSIGTNDLIQYALAVDRLNEKITHLYEPTHPAILRLIRMTVEAAQRNNIWVGVCGEMAGDPVLVPLLLGLGINELSTAIGGLPQVKFLIRRLKMSEARELAEFALQCNSAAEIQARCEKLAHELAPDLFGS